METVNQEETTAQQQERNFTQAEVNAIVSDRLSREREKYVGYDELKAKAEKFDAAEGDLKKAQEQAAQYKAQVDAYQKEISVRNAREKVASDMGVPVGLLTGETEEDCKAQAEGLLAWRGQQPNYPNLKDAGESHNIPAGKPRDQFANWFRENM